MSYTLTETAKQDLEEILAYIAEDNLQAAYNWLDKLYENMDKLSLQPKMGHARLDLTSHPVRFWPVGNYLIVYALDAKNYVTIVRVLNGYRDIVHLLT